MLKNIALIWDLDGTLFDSYEVIVSSMYQALEEIKISMAKEDILEYAIRYSLGDLISRMVEEYGIDGDALNKRCTSLRDQRMFEITAAPHAKDILLYLREKGIHNYIYTHRGNSTRPILSHLGLEEFFEEIITATDGYARKPAPDAVNYLMEKYKLDPKSTYYVGDRKIDMECGRNAGIGTILYLPDYSVGSASGIEDYVISDFLKMKEIF